MNIKYKYFFIGSLFALPLLFFFVKKKRKLSGIDKEVFLKSLFAGDLENNEVTLIKNTTFSATLQTMQEMAHIYAYQVAPLAQYLKRKTAADSCRALFDFLMTHFVYKDDRIGEELRTPLRSFYDRKKGIDCDCFSILIAAVLEKWGYPYVFRVVRLYESGDFAHVYVVAKISGKEIPLDPVIKAFNYETPYYEKKDFQGSKNITINV